MCDERITHHQWATKSDRLPSPSNISRPHVAQSCTSATTVFPTMPFIYKNLPVVRLHIPTVCRFWHKSIKVGVLNAQWTQQRGSKCSQSGPSSVCGVALIKRAWPWQRRLFSITSLPASVYPGKHHHDDSRHLFFAISFPLSSFLIPHSLFLLTSFSHLPLPPSFLPTSFSPPPPPLLLRLLAPPLLLL